MKKEKGAVFPTVQESRTWQGLDRAGHRMLIFGLSLSIGILLIGLSLTALARSPVPDKAVPFRQVFTGLATASPSSFLSLGVLLLIATPILRVLSLLAEFVIKRDWLYACITILVLAILALSALIGRG